MSAECGRCGSDIVYPEGTWPLGECPSCTRDERIDALVAQVDTLTRERDAHKKGHYDALKKWERQVERAEAAEAALADTRRALEQIAALPVPGADGWMEIPAERPMKIARRALAGDTEGAA